MFRVCVFLLLIACSSLSAQRVVACGAHDIYFNPDAYGVVGKTFITLAGMAPPKPVFTVKHFPVVKTLVGENSEIAIEYERPWLSKDVRIELTSTNGVTLLDKEIPLDSYDGIVKVNYQLDKVGFNSITVKVKGNYKGREEVKTSLIYVQAKKASTVAQGS